MVNQKHVVVAVEVFDRAWLSCFSEDIMVEDASNNHARSNGFRVGGCVGLAWGEGAYNWVEGCPHWACVRVCVMTPVARKR